MIIVGYFLMIIILFISLNDFIFFLEPKSVEYVQLLVYLDNAKKLQ